MELKELYIAPEVEIVCFRPVEKLAVFLTGSWGDLTDEDGGISGGDGVVGGGDGDGEEEE